MFTPGRYVAIDDNRDELRLLVDALHELGAPCVGIHYKPDKGVDAAKLRGVRILFLDLHLLGGMQGADDAMTFEVIRELLDTGITPDAGPYVIVLWTSHAEKREPFQQYLVERLDRLKLPLAILSLDKKKYLGGGKADGEALQTDIFNAISTDPRLQALLNWEKDVLAAAGATLAAVGALVDPVFRTPADYGEKLDQVISVLARAAAGKDHAAANVKAAVNGALAPILADRILNRGPDAESEAIWNAAITHVADAAPLGEAEAARINTMLHLALPPAEPVAPTDWGALLVVPDEELVEERMLARFSLSAGQLKHASCPARKSSGKKKCLQALLRLGASCDYAQNKIGPIAYVSCLVVPIGVELRDANSISKAVLATPVLDVPEVGPARIFVDARYQITLVANDVAHLAATGRIREQLLMQVAAHCAEYVMRPGIVSIEPGIPEPEVEEAACGVSCGTAAAAAAPSSKTS